MDNRIDKLENKIDEINSKLDKLILLINNDVKPNCTKMSTHIDFIDRVYDNVKSPMYYICDKLNNMKTISYNFNN